MENKTVKLTNFKKIQEELNILAKEYETAKQNKDSKKLEEIKVKYEDLKTLLRSNAVYFKKLDKYEVNNQIANTDDETKISHLEARKREKNVYKSNRNYISMVEKAATLDDYIEKNSKKKLNFVKKHFKPIAVAAASIILLGSLSSCKFGKNKNETSKVGYTTEAQIVEEPTTEEVIEVNTEDETNDNKIKLNDLVDVDNETKTTKKYSDNYLNKTIPGTTGTGTGTSKGVGTSQEKAMDPHTDEIEQETSQPESSTSYTDENGNDVTVTVNPDGTTTTITTIKEESVEEPEAVDYPTETIDNTGIPKEEKVTIEEKEERENTIDINDNNITIEEEKTTQTNTNRSTTTTTVDTTISETTTNTTNTTNTNEIVTENGEKVTYEYIEVKEDVYTGDLVEETTEYEDIYTGDEVDETYNGDIVEEDPYTLSLGM